MAYDAHVNLGFSTVATAPSTPTAGTSLVLNAGDGAKMPAVPFNMTVSPPNATRLQVATQSEIVRVTARATDTLTITRAAEGPNAARAIAVGDEIAVTTTAKVFTDIEANAADKTSTSTQVFSGDIGGGSASASIGAAAGYLLDNAGVVSVSNAAASNVFTSTSSGDTTGYRFSIAANGLHSWGPGTGAVDTNLYRSAAGILRSDNSIYAANLSTGPNTGIGGGTTGWFFSNSGTAFVTMAANNNIISSGQTADATAHFTISRDGTLTWGPAGGPLDTLLGRTAVGQLALGSTTSKGIFQQYVSATSDIAQAIIVTTDANPRFTTKGDGTLAWGPGGATATDTTLSRGAAGVLLAGNSISTGPTALGAGGGGVDGVFINNLGQSSFILGNVGNTAIGIGLNSPTDTVYRFTILGSGALSWGPGGAAATDLNFTRQGVALGVFDCSTGTASRGFGYRTAVGNGTSVTQLTSRNTGVTSNFPCGQIITNGTSLANGAVATFAVTCNAVAATDVIILTVVNTPTTAGSMIPIVTAVAAGTFSISYTNNSGAATTQVLSINYAIIKSATS